MDRGNLLHERYLGQLELQLRDVIFQPTDWKGLPPAAGHRPPEAQQRDGASVCDLPRVVVHRLL